MRGKPEYLKRKSAHLSEDKNGIENYACHSGEGPKLTSLNLRGSRDPNCLVPAVAWYRTSPSLVSTRKFNNGVINGTVALTIASACSMHLK